jgi:hypothetical protein
MTSVLITDLPEPLSLVLEIQAARAKNSVSEHIVAILEKHASSISFGEWLDLLTGSESVDISSDEIVAIIHAERDTR